MIVTAIDSLDSITGALFYAEFPQWYWDGETMRPINDAAKVSGQ